jgi:hypothetical protein
MSKDDFNAFKNKVIVPPFSSILKYHIRYAIFLASVPLICGVLLLLLLWVFTTLNLYFFEANGMLVDEQIRGAYFKQVELETYGVIGYLILQVAVSLVASFLVMRWATAPFSSGEAMVRTAMDDPANLKPSSKWMSESPAFDRVIWLFCLRVKSGGENQVKDFPSYGLNIPFLAKFLLTFGTLSVSTGYVLSIIMDSVYRRIVELSFQLVKSKNFSGHYFVAQQEILQTATNLTIGVAVLIYLYMGIQISKHMSNMLFVFSRAVRDDRFPIYLRAGDLFTGLADTMNKARERIK